MSKSVPIMIQNDLERIADFDPSLWQMLKGKTIFATGCTGFIGAWIIHSFNHLNRHYQLGASLILLTRNKEKFLQSFPGLPSSITIHLGDIKDFTFPDQRIDYIIHGATEVASFQAGNNPSELLDVSYFGTKKMVELARLKKVSNVLFLSSGAAYGQQPMELNQLAESYTGAPATHEPKSTYGEAKRVGEMLLFNEKSFSSVSARIFAACGPYLPLKSEFAFSNFLESCYKNENIIIKSNGLSTRSYLYAGDLALWLWILLIRGENGQIYNVGSEEEISILELAQRMKTILAKDIKIEVQGSLPGHTRYIPSNQKIMTKYNIKSQVSFEEAVIKSYDFLKANYEI